MFYAYFLLFVTVLLLWSPIKNKNSLWGLTLIAAIICGLISNLIEPVTLIPIALLAIACFFWQHENSRFAVHFIAGFIVLLICIAFDIHQMPGFHNLEIIHQRRFTPDAIPYSLYLNFDKCLTGILILGFSTHLIHSKKDWLILIKELVILLPIVVLAIILAALLLGFVRVDFKFPSTSLLWCLDNLFFVCVAEEAFFRGFIQKNLTTIFQKIKYGKYLAILVASLLFGLAHFPGGVKYVFLATLAGGGYGWIFYKTKRIEGSILTHFALNIIHFFIFTYPAIAVNV